MVALRSPQREEIKCYFRIIKDVVIFLALSLLDYKLDTTKNISIEDGITDTKSLT